MRAVVTVEGSKGGRTGRLNIVSSRANMLNLTTHSLNITKYLCDEIWPCRSTQSSRHRAFHNQANSVCQGWTSTSTRITLCHTAVASDSCFGSHLPRSRMARIAIGRSMWPSIVSSMGTAANTNTSVGHILIAFARRSGGAALQALRIASEYGAQAGAGMLAGASSAGKTMHRCRSELRRIRYGSSRRTLLHLM